MKSFQLITIAVALLAAGCARQSDDSASIEQAIKRHLSQRQDLALNQLVLEMGDVQINGEEAAAEVVFRTTSDPPARMAYHYDLRRQDGDWQVASGRPSSGGNEHPSMGGPGDSPAGLPEGHPPIDELPPNPQ
jgi:hypothetical protein